MAVHSPSVAVVIPFFNEEKVLPELLRRLVAVCDSQPAYQWRVILVNDGSRDGGAALVRAHAAKDTRFNLIELSRNFGHQSALAAGLVAAANEDAAITLDADLQDPPELMPQMLDRWRQGMEVVLAVRKSRRETGLRRLGFDLFHLTLQQLADFPIPPNTGTFGLLDRAAVEAFNGLPERHRFFPGLRAWVGFAVGEVEYDRDERAAGKPTQSFGRLMAYALDGVFSFSYLPLRTVTYFGMFVAGLGFAFGLFFAIRRLLGIEIAQLGFTTLVILVVFIGGVQLIGIGIVGEYLGRIYDEVKRRPLYIVKRHKTND